MLLFLAVGCGLTAIDDDTPGIEFERRPNQVVDSGTTPPTPTPMPQPAPTNATGNPFPPGLHGEVPAEPLAVPDFVATNRDGTPRGPEHLRGSVTVMWFYPAAFTGG